MIGQYVARFSGQNPTRRSRRITKWHHVESTIADRVVVSCREMAMQTKSGSLIAVQAAELEGPTNEEVVCETCL